MRALPLAVLLLGGLLLAPASADPAPPAYVQPGERVTSPSGQCTLNFVFDGVGDDAGNVYVGTAAHCVGGVGEAMSILGASGFGTVVYAGDPDWDVTAGADVPTDFALILVAPAHHAIVRADVKGIAGAPSGHTTAQETSTGDALQVSGYGLGFSAVGPTRERRAGLLLEDHARGYQAYLPTIFGDSGGPVVDLKTGKALGTISGIQAACCWFPEVTYNGAYDYGPTVEGILGDLAAAGFDVALRTAA